MELGDDARLQSIVSDLTITSPLLSDPESHGLKLWVDKVSNR